MTRKSLPILVLLVLFVTMVSAAPVLAQGPKGGPRTGTSVMGTAFTYQGQLKSGGSAYTGTCDFQFKLYDSTSGGAQISTMQTVTAASVTGGLFTVTIDFGAAAFNGEARWLDIGVRCPAGGGDYAALTPRQALTPAPYALYSSSAPWSGLSGIPSPIGFLANPSPCSSGQAATWNGTTWTCAAATSYSAGNGLTLVGTQFSADTTYLQRRVSGTCGAGNAIRVIASDGTVTCEAIGSGSNWLLTGNGGTNPSTNFVGTTDNVAFEFRVNNSRALRLEPNSTSPNVIGGGTGSTVMDDVYGATIAGGGRNSVGITNFVTDNYGTIGGGDGNRAGNYNSVQNDASYATVAGGWQNFANAASATVSGGYMNNANGTFSTVSGGTLNSADGPYATVGGGVNNIAGANEATVSGGYMNHANGLYATVGGGNENLVTSTLGTIAGGKWITVTGDYGTVGGGTENLVTSTVGTIAGGKWITVTGDYGTVGGGINNIASGSKSTVSGGNRNVASSFYAAVGGGYNNHANGDKSVIGGGIGNTADGWGATVPGGMMNSAWMSQTLAAGYRAKANNAGTFVWADSTEADFTSTGNNQFLIRAGGGVGINTNNPANNSLQVAKDEASSAGYGQIEATGATNHDKRLTLGFDTTNDIGWIQASESWVGNHPLVLNPNGGNVGVGTTLPVSTLQVVGGYIQFPTISGGEPPAGDCAGAWHYGRVVVRTDGSVNLYVCTAGGWIGK